MHTLCTHDFASLKKTEANWSEQTVISVQTKTNFLTCAIHQDFRIPTLIRYVGGRYTGDDRDVSTLLNNIHGKVPYTTYAEALCVLTV